MIVYNQRIECRSNEEVDRILSEMGRDGMRLVAVIFNQHTEVWFLFFTSA